MEPVAQTLLGRVITTGYYWFVLDWKPKLLFRLKALKGVMVVQH